MSKNNIKLNTYTFNNPSFLKGMAKVLDLGLTSSSFYNNLYTHLDDELIDYLALKNDWMAVGEDFRDSIKKYEKEKQKEKIQKCSSPTTSCPAIN